MKGSKEKDYTLERIISFLLERFHSILRSTLGEREYRELRFTPKHRHGKKKASSSQETLSGEDIFGLFTTPPHQYQDQGVDQADQANIAQPVVQAAGQTSSQSSSQPSGPTMRNNLPPPNGASRMVTNPSPLVFSDYHDMPKNPKNFCLKFNVNDLNWTPKDHIKLFEDILWNRPIEYGDLACRLFTYSLGD